MKTRKLIQRLNRAELQHNLNKAKDLWFKILKKSFKHKDTHSVK